jgi:YVTN family beta-propeller protein
MDATAITGPIIKDVRAVLAVAVVLASHLAVAAPSLAADNTSYARGELITVSFAGGPGSATDWVGIYPAGATPGQVGSTLWFYVGGSKAAGAALTTGSLTFGPGSGAWPLSAGTWNAFFLANDGYDILAQTTFTVSAGAQAILSTDRTIYRPGQPITISFARGPGNATDWVGLYPEDGVPGQGSSLQWLYVGGSQTPGAALAAGTLTFGPGAGPTAFPLPEGRYRAFLLADDGYSVLGRASFWVGIPGQTALTTEGWLVAPAGRQSLVGSGPLAITATPDGRHLLVANAGYNHQSLMLVEAASGRVVQTVAGQPDEPGGLYLGLVVSRDGRRVFASDGTNDSVRTFSLEGGALTEGQPLALPPGTWPAGLALSGDERRLWVTGNLSDQVLVLDLARGAVVASAPVGHLPYGVALSRNGARAFVSAWGADTVTVLDGKTAAVTATLKVGMHPSAVLQSPVQDELYVADTDSDELTVIDSARGVVLRTLSLAPWLHAPPGASPNALALAPDGRTLYVANAGDDDVAVVRLGHGRERPDRLQGLIPTGWFPSGLAVSPAGRTLYVVNMKGLGVGPVKPGGYIADQLQGTLSTIDVPDEGQLSSYTDAVERNDHFPGETDDDGCIERDEHGAHRSVVPHAVGEASPVKHVIYVLKENRTFDQVLGDLGRGNGDPSLAIFGAAITPNHHELARRFVTFDNFYCDGEVSADGWIWSNAASANTYNQKNWPLDYGWANRLYDFGGFGNDESAGFPGPDPLHAFLWDRLAKAGISYRNYGFFVNGLEGPQNQVTVSAAMPGLLGHTDLAYPGWDMYYPDQLRIQEWVAEFRGFEAAGRMPTVQLVYLPRDHTVGTATGQDAPEAMVADNDAALGTLVETVSHSRFWKSTAIFVIEDDAQDGPDHVDGHRTVAMVVSPYTQTGMVDSTRYSTVSMLRTMELLVGVEPLTHFDALARPIRKPFTLRPDLRPYERVSANEAVAAKKNASSAPLAAESARLDFRRPDAADRRTLNRAIWESVKGKGSRIPEVRRPVSARGGDR